ncbi:NAD(P)-dependent oxidoreductase [Thiomonas sp.]|uniref:NAD(P)-dependent oxidoreductase n=1 Tax=Thiomonas sp. TaxID=2047785 RepID=UPI00261A95D5|nr:NAD(P)-dependent oxidoreductase [Thiomonas sp.]
MARVALIGASGNAGSRILKELSDRGHQVSAIARNTDNIPRLAGVTAVRGDAQDVEGLAALLRGHDVVVSSVHFTASDPARLIMAVRRSGVRRYLVVGGAGSLLVAPGKRLVDQPEFPAQYRAEALAGAAFLDLLRTVEDLEWTFVSPSALFVPGERTGTFRLGEDQLLVGPDGSRISFEDFAIAMTDEIEKPAHIRRRFTVGY